MANLATEARRLVSRPFLTETNTWGLRTNHPANNGRAQITSVGTYADALKARREMIGEITDWMREHGAERHDRP